MHHAKMPAGYLVDKDLSAESAIIRGIFVAFRLFFEVHFRASITICKVLVKIPRTHILVIVRRHHRQLDIV